MVEICDNQLCCGCGACNVVCPIQCISMKENEEGFRYPVIDSSKCMDCGSCQKVCPILQDHRIKNNLTVSMVAYNRDEDVRLASSSGGIFSLLAERILEQNGVVFGASFEQNFQVHHVGIAETRDLEKLRGSKYVQSDTKKTYIEAREALQAGKKVLFTGTACQISGLKSYLGKEYESLFTVDVLCHGVPSGKVWRRYIMEQEGLGKIDSISFRNKKLGWKNYSMRIKYKDKVYERRFRRDPFMMLFLSDICLRKSCYHCLFKGDDRCSDITIGDAWGIEFSMPDMDDDKGSSIIWIHSQKGMKLVQLIEQNIVSREVELDLILSPEANSRKSVAPHPRSQEFYQRLNRGDKIIKLSKMVKPSIFTRGYYRIQRELKKSKLLRSN